MTYNILLGGRGREHLITAVIERCDPDVVALQEVTDPSLARRLARRFGMTLLVGRPSDPGTDMHNVILTRLAVRRWSNHRHPGSMLRSHLEAELDVGERSAIGASLRVHCLHLAARFGEKANGEVRRMRELDDVFRDLHALAERPHIIVGDLNAVSPGDTVAAGRFFRTMSRFRRAGVLSRGADGQWGPRLRTSESDAALDAGWRAVGMEPLLDVSLPRLPGAVFPLTRNIPRGPGMDRLLNRFIERWSVERMLDAGYTDCFRRAHPRATGYTCATWVPVSRIDYVFATADVAERLVRCDVVGGRDWPDRGVLAASDHWPLVADFRV